MSLLTLGVIASFFSLGNLGEVIGSLIAVRVLIQYLPQTIGFFLLRVRAPQMDRPFKMWFYPIPGIVSLFGWLYVLGTATPKSLMFALVVLIIGAPRPTPSALKSAANGPSGSVRKYKRVREQPTKWIVQKRCRLR